jgi:hypothetical protein
VIIQQGKAKLTIFNKQRNHMGLLTPKGKKDDKKKSNTTKSGAQPSKFFTSKPAKGSGKKPLTGGSQRGS